MRLMRKNFSESFLPAIISTNQPSLTEPSHCQRKECIACMRSMQSNMDPTTHNNNPISTPKRRESDGGEVRRKSMSNFDEESVVLNSTKDAVEKCCDGVPDSVKSRFREGGFCKWGGAWLPVLELGPFDVEGNVREMWLAIFHDSEKHGREMKRLVYWYGVKYVERGQAYSFVKGNQLIDYEEGKQKGCCQLPKKILNKIAKEQTLSRKEERHKRGLAEIESDMQQEHSKRAKWMMQFKEDSEGNEEKSSKTKRKPRSKPFSLALPDEVASANVNVGVDMNGFQHSPKRARRAEPLPSPVLSLQHIYGSEHGTYHEQIKAEPTPPSAVPSMGMGCKPNTVARQRPTPAECNLVVQELGKLHPDVVAVNDQRREVFALQKQQTNDLKKAASKHGGKNTPVTDAIISTMLSQNTTAANQNRAFASLKKAYPGGWETVANETNKSRIEDAIRVAGLAQIRAERMQMMLQTIQQERGEANFEYLQHFESNEIIRELSRHKGMGPKTISCVLLFALGRPDFPVDTHVLRISKQMGWVPQSFSREAAYEYMNERVPDECKLDLHCLLVTHGKQCNKCAARGRAQFPPKVQWICPMAAIKNGKLIAATDSSAVCCPIDQKRSIVKEEIQSDSTPLLKSKQPVPISNSSKDEVKVKVEDVT